MYTRLVFIYSSVKSDRYFDAARAKIFYIFLYLNPIFLYNKFWIWKIPFDAFTSYQIFIGLGDYLIAYYMVVNNKRSSLYRFHGKNLLSNSSDPDNSCEKKIWHNLLWTEASCVLNSCQVAENVCGRGKYLFKKRTAMYRHVPWQNSFFLFHWFGSNMNTFGQYN